MNQASDESIITDESDENREETRHQALRRQILEIHNSQSLTPKEKAQRTQALVSGRTYEVAESSAPKGPKTWPINPEDLQPSYRDTSETVYGCKHYRVGCKIRAECCGRFFPCRFCHDESSDHEIDRYATKEMMCMGCMCVQPTARTCTDCHIRVALYYCDTCKFFDDSRSRTTYHCYHCNCCRVGQGLGIDYFHCMKCSACMPMSLRDHRCIEHTLASNCPICHEIMFNSTTPLLYMPCGHCMHRSCYQQYIQYNYTCPICFKSVGNMTNYIQQMDIFMSTQDMPSEYRNTRSNILCNDCERRSQTSFHFIYHKCPSCGSYNTRALSYVNHPHIGT